MEAHAERQSGVELLRILAAMGVIALHYCNPGIGGGFKFVESGSINSSILLFVESLYICAVNIFMIISGYFMCRSLKADLKKPIGLLLQLIVFEVVLFLLKVLAGQGEFSWQQLFITAWPKDYFVIFYSVTYVLAPYINLMLRKLGKKRIRKLIIVIFLLFSVQPGVLWLIKRMTGIDITAASTITYIGSSGGYTIVNFVMCYIIGAGIGYGAIKLSKKVLAVLALACVLLIFYYRTWDYCHPLVVIEAAAFFMLFKELPVQSKIINRLARASFTVYLLHRTFVVRAGVKLFVNRSPAIMLGHILAVQISIYLICFVVFIIWNLSAGRILDKLWAKFKAPAIVLEPV